MSIFQNTKIISITNQKGGVGKTTTAINLATALATIDKKVLVIDFDPQGNASTGLGIEQNERSQDIYTLLFEKNSFNEVIKQTKIKNLDVIPASIDLSAAEIDLANMEEKTLKLRSLFEKNQFLSKYDYILIDCPPALGFLTLNSLCASDSVMIPLQCEFFALEGLSQLMNTVRLVKQFYNPNIEIEGVILTMKDSRSNLVNQVAKEIQEFFGKKVYETVIPRNVRLAEAPSHGLPIYLYDNRSSGGVAYNELAREFLRRNKDNGVLMDKKSLFKGVLEDE